MHATGQQRAQPPLSSSHSKFHLQISNGFTTESPKMSASITPAIAKLKKARQREMSEFGHQHQQKTGSQLVPYSNLAPCFRPRTKGWVLNAACLLPASVPSLKMLQSPTELRITKDVSKTKPARPTQAAGAATKTCCNPRCRQAAQHRPRKARKGFKAGCTRSHQKKKAALPYRTHPCSTAPTLIVSV